MSTTATVTTNVHHQSNGSVVDPNAMVRLPSNQQPYMMQSPYAHIPMQIMHQYHPQIPYAPHMVRPRMQDMMPPAYHDHTQHPGLTKVPINPNPLTMRPTAPIPTGVPVSLSSVPNTAAPAKKRERKPALIKNPNTGQQVSLDELGKSTETPVKQETIATEAQALPAASETAQTSSSPVTENANVDPVTSTTKTTTEILEKKMKDVTLDTVDSSSTAGKQIDTNEITKQSSPEDPAQEISSPKSVRTATNGSERDKVVLKHEEVASVPSAIQTKSIPAHEPPQATPTKSIQPDSKSGPDDAPEVKSIESSGGDPIKAADKEINPVGEDSASKPEDKSPEIEESSKTVESSADDSKKLPEKKQQSLPYQPGQYSPQNLQGRKKYSREFLKAVHESMKTELDQRYGPPGVSDNARVDFMAPSFISASSFNNYRDPPSSRRSSQQAMVRPKRVIATSSLQPEIELKTTENAWKPELEQEKSKAVEAGEMDTARLLKVFRGHLNKLTPQKYDSIIEKVKALDLADPERLASVIDLVFDKAVDEPGFCELYAKMCKVIGAKHDGFFTQLVKKCQEEFETSDLYHGLNIDSRKEAMEQETDPQKKKIMSEELYEDMRLRRKKYLGTIKLIGEMYKFGLLIPKIIALCMTQLLDEVSNENLECLCSLLTTVGAKMACEEDDAIKNYLNKTIKVLQEFAHSKKVEDSFVLESRIKFKILDTIDLSRKNWRPRMVENNPKKIEEIREEIKEDKLRQQNHSNQNRSMLKNDDRDRHRRPGNLSYGKNQNSRWT